AMGCSSVGWWGEVVRSLQRRGSIGRRGADAQGLRPGVSQPRGGGRQVGQGDADGVALGPLLEADVAPRGSGEVAHHVEAKTRFAAWGAVQVAGARERLEELDAGLWAELLAAVGYQPRAVAVPAFHGERHLASTRQLHGAAEHVDEDEPRQTRVADQRADGFG